MSAYAPPPPPPGGNGPSGFGPVFPPGANDGGDGSSMDKATWVAGSKKNERYFCLQQGQTWIRCNLRDAYDLWDSGYKVYTPNNPKPIKSKWAAVARHDHPSGEEDLAEEEYDFAGDAFFDEEPRTPSRGYRGQGFSSPSSGGGRAGSSTPHGPGSGSSQPGSDGRRGANLFGILRGSGGSGKSRQGQASPMSPKSPSDRKGKGPIGVGSPGAA